MIQNPIRLRLQSYVDEDEDEDEEEDDNDDEESESHDDDDDEEIDMDVEDHDSPTFWNGPTALSNQLTVMNENSWENKIYIWKKNSNIDGCT